MRGVLAVLTVTLAVGAGRGQSPPPADAKPADRYGVAANPKSFPQATVKDALGSVVKALDSQRYEYLAAHLIAPDVMDAKVAERAAASEAAVAKSLELLREAQRRNPSQSGTVEPVPLSPDGFAERLKTEVTARAFQSVQRSIVETLTESPEHVRLMGRFARDGVITESGATATVSLKDVPNKQVYLKQANGRWYVEDRQSEAAKPKDSAPPPKSDK